MPRPLADSGHRFPLGWVFSIGGFEASDALPEDTLQLDKGPGVPRGIAAELQSSLKESERFECVAYRTNKHVDLMDAGRGQRRSSV